MHPWHCIISSSNLLSSDDAAVLPGVGLQGLLQLLHPGLKDLLLLADSLQRFLQSLLVVNPAVVQLVLTPEQIVVFCQCLVPCLQYPLPGLVLLYGGRVGGDGVESNLLSGAHLLFLLLHGIELLVQQTHVLQRLLVGFLHVFYLLPLGI